MKKVRFEITMPALFLASILMFLTACGDDFSASNFAPVAGENNGSSDSEGGNGEPGDIEDNLQICSTLDFSGISWPLNFSLNAQNSFALALNITGSFEGHLSWATIAGDSDGQGMSLGLLQQNFGTGTLQPLMAAMKKNHPEKMKSFFTSNHWVSFSAMLDEWTRVNPVIIATGFAENFAAEPLFYPDDAVVSPLDENYPEAALFQPFADSDITKTLTWARQTILTGKNVKSDWKKEFQNLASSTEYRNSQFREALVLHTRTENYRAYFKFKTLTAYLFLYDIVVQNGSLKDKHKNAYQAYIKQNPTATEIQRLQKLLEIRLPDVRPQYQADVKARKMTIINGTGTVHGSRRNLPKEYCFKGALPI